MKGNNFSNKLASSIGIQMIVGGLARLVEHEGHTPREALEVLREVESNTWSALNQIHDEKR